MVIVRQKIFNVYDYINKKNDERKEREDKFVNNQTTVGAAAKGAVLGGLAGGALSFVKGGKGNFKKFAGIGAAVGAGVNGLEHSIRKGLNKSKKKLRESGEIGQWENGSSSNYSNSYDY